MDAFKQSFAKLLTELTDIPVTSLVDMIEIPPENIPGDYGFPCFQLSKIRKQSPADIAKDLEEKLTEQDGDVFAAFQAVGPYINAFANPAHLAQDVISAVLEEKRDYGRGLDIDQLILLEGWQPNTHKAFHIGHVRNAVMSESVARILEFAGYNVVRTSYMGDVGAHVAKWLRYYTNFYDGDIPTSDVAKRAGELYAIATKKVDENPDTYKQQIHDVHSKLESGDEALVTLRKKTRQLCIEDMKRILDELDCSIERRYRESEVEQPGIEKVKELEKDGIAQYSEGAIIMDLKEYGLDVFLLLKSNGASLYSTKDIALAYLKQKEYNYTTSLYIVGAEQEHHFRQLFKTLEIIGFDARSLQHVSYGLVVLKDGKMSSREGNVVLYQDIRDQLIQKATELIEKRELDPSHKGDIAKDVAFAAIKFPMLLQESHKQIVFDPEAALSFEGESGPYIQYAYARCTSLLTKGHFTVNDDTADYTNLATDEERTLLLHLYRFPQIVEKAAWEYKPNYIARYLLELTQLFNHYYQTTKILSDDGDQSIQTARLALVASVKQVLHNGLHLLGINTPEEM